MLSQAERAWAPASRHGSARQRPAGVHDGSDTPQMDGHKPSRVRGCSLPTAAVGRAERMTPYPDDGTPLEDEPRPQDVVLPHVANQDQPGGIPWIRAHYPVDTGARSTGPRAQGTIVGTDPPPSRPTLGLSCKGRPSRAPPAQRSRRESRHQHQAPLVSYKPLLGRIVATSRLPVRSARRCRTPRTRQAGHHAALVHHGGLQERPVRPQRAHR